MTKISIFYKYFKYSK